MDGNWVKHYSFLLWSFTEQWRTALQLCSKWQSCKEPNFSQCAFPRIGRGKLERSAWRCGCLPDSSHVSYAARCKSLAAREKSCVCVCRVTKPPLWEAGITDLLPLSSLSQQRRKKKKRERQLHMYSCGPAELKGLDKNTGHQKLQVGVNTEG